MKIRNYIVIAAMLTFNSLLIVSCNNDTSNAADSNGEQAETVIAEPSIEEVIAHGKYLVTILGCNDCHSPKKMGEMGPEVIAELMLSGYPADRPVVKFDIPMLKEGFGLFYPDLTAAAGPWGVSFAANITPDETGIGNWTEEQFSRALRQGKSKGLEGGRMLLPPMPWPSYAEMNDTDLHAIFSYLKSIDPVENLVPQPISPDMM